MIRILNKQATISELDQIIEIHLQVFKNELSSNFGKKYLLKFYQDILKYQKGYFIVAELNNSIKGFILFTTQQFNLQINIGLKELFLFVMNVFCKPVLLLKLTSRLIDKRREIGAYEISFFAISEKSQSNGLGSKLLIELKNLCFKEKIGHVYTFTSNFKLKEYYIKKHKAHLIYINSFLGFKSYYIKIPTTNPTFK